MLEIGCGWGSLTLYLARHFPRSRITAVSNSSAQRLFIEARARSEGFRNVRVITADINTFRTRQKFDRIVSVETFEHARNYELLWSSFERTMAHSGW